LQSGRGSAALIALTTLRRAGIPVPGLGVAAAPKRRGVPVRLSGMGANVLQPFYGTTITVRDVADELAYWSETWAVRRGNDTGYADAFIQRDPATCGEELRATAEAHCGLYPAACEGIDVGAIIADSCAEYAQWFGQEFPSGWGNAYSVNQSQPSPWEDQGYYAQTPQTVSVFPSGGGNQAGYTIPNTVTPTYGTAPASGPAVTGGGGSMSTPPASSTGNGASGPVVLTLRNTSRPNSPLASGDSFELVITGSPYSPVQIDATRNGSQRGVSEVGSTDGQGLKIISGRMSENEIGSWVEVVKVGSSTATISFSVGAAPGMTQGGGPAAAGGSTNAGGGGSTAIPGTVSPVMAAVSGGLPSWVIPAAIAAAAVLMLRK